MVNTDFTISQDNVDHVVRPMHEWLGGGKWLGRVNHVHPDGYGFLTIFEDDGRIVQDPNGHDVNQVWFWNKELKLMPYDRVVCELEDASNKEKKKRKNPYYLQTTKGTVRHVNDITAIGKRGQKAFGIHIDSLRDDYLDCVVYLGERIFITDEYAVEIERRLQANLDELYAKKEEALKQEYHHKHKALENEQMKYTREKEQLDTK